MWWHSTILLTQLTTRHDPTYRWRPPRPQATALYPTRSPSYDTRSHLCNLKPTVSSQVVYVVWLRCWLMLASLSNRSDSITHVVWSERSRNTTLHCLIFLSLVGSCDVSFISYNIWILPQFLRNHFETWHFFIPARTRQWSVVLTSA